MNIHVFLLLILILGIVPNLGYFSFGSFFLLSIFGIVSWIILRNPPLVKEDSRHAQWGIAFIYLISAYYYGGLYQNPMSILVGQIIFFSFCLYICFHIYSGKVIKSHIFLVVFVILSALTIYGSPHPVVDTFVILKEAPQKLLQGINPYHTTFSEVYKGVVTGYFTYLPVSILYLLPFVYLFNDPRMGIVIAMVGTYLLMNRLQQKKNSQKYLYSSLVLFLPRSFYMIEHTYLDTLIFFFYILTYYFYQKERTRLFSFILGCLFLFKQNMMILLPIFFSALWKKKENILFFSLPFLSVVFFLVWNPTAFINSIFTIMQSNSLIMIGNPIQVKLVVPNILFQLLHFSKSQMQIVFSICTGIILMIATFLLLSKKLSDNRKVILILFFGYFFSYHAYFNSYYIILLLLSFDFIVAKE